MVDKRAYSYHVQRVSDCEVFIIRWGIYTTTPTRFRKQCRRGRRRFSKDKNYVELLDPLSSGHERATAAVVRHTRSNNSSKQISKIPPTDDEQLAFEGYE